MDRPTRIAQCAIVLALVSLVWNVTSAGAADSGRDLERPAPLSVIGIEFDRAMRGPIASRSDNLNGLAVTLGEVEHNATGGAAQLVGEIAAAMRQALAHLA